jgi:hypothetical protein
MSNEVQAAIVGGILGIVGALSAAALPLWIAKRQLEGKLAEISKAKDDAAQVATGLAVAYYANFLGAIFELLKLTEIRVHLNPRAEGQQPIFESFPRNNVKIRCIAPITVTGPRINQCYTVLSKYITGEIIRPGSNQRGFTINYGISQRGSERVLEIYDIAKPLFAIQNYLFFFRNLKETDPQWSDVSEIARSSFVKTIEDLRVVNHIDREQFNFEIIE